MPNFLNTSVFIGVSFSDRSVLIFGLARQKASRVTGAGGRPSTWSPPGGLAEPSRRYSRPGTNTSSTMNDQGRTCTVRRATKRETATLLYEASRPRQKFNRKVLHKRGTTVSRRQPLSGPRWIDGPARLRLHPYYSSSKTALRVTLLALHGKRPLESPRLWPGCRSTAGCK